MTHRFSELGPHLLLVPGVLERPSRLLFPVDVGKAEKHEPLAHRAHDGVVAVDRRGAAGDEADLALPMERLAPAGANLARPAAVVDLAERGERLGACVPVHREDAAEVFADDDPEVADRSEQATLRAGLALFPRSAGEQRGRCHGCGRVHVGKTRDRGEQL